MKIIIDKEKIIKDFDSYMGLYYEKKIPQPFISKWDNTRPSSEKQLNNPYIKLLFDMGYIDIFRMVGVLSNDRNPVIYDYPRKLHYKDFFLKWGGSDTPYELTYCDFVVNCFTFKNAKLENILDFCNKKKIRVISPDDYYNELTKKDK